MIGDHPMRKFEQQIFDVEIMKAILDSIDFVNIAANDGGYPYVVPTNFGYEFKDDKLFVYIHGAGEGHKLDVWAKDPRVTLTFAMFQNHPQQTYRGAIHDFRCIMANGVIRPVDKKTETGLWGHAVQKTLAHHMRRPTQFSVPHYMFMRMFVVECDMKNVSCKSEQALYSVEDVPFPSMEELAGGGADKPDYSWRDAIVRKNYALAPSGRAEKPAASGRLEKAPLPEGENSFEFFWDAPDDGSVDADLYGYVRNADGSISRRYCLAFYSQRRDLYGALEFCGDDMQGAAGSECMKVDVSKLPESAGEVLFVLAMHRPEQSGLDLSAIGSVVLSVNGGKDGVFDIDIDGSGKRAAVYARLAKEGSAWQLESFDGEGLGSWRIDEAAAELGLGKWKE